MLHAYLSRVFRLRGLNVLDLQCVQKDSFFLRIEHLGVDLNLLNLVKTQIGHFQDNIYHSFSTSFIHTLDLGDLVTAACFDEFDQFIVGRRPQLKVQLFEGVAFILLPSIGRG